VVLRSTPVRAGQRFPEPLAPLLLVEYVAVWALKTPVPHTDVLKTHSSQSFSTELLEYKGTGSEHLSQTNPSKLSFSLSYNRIPKYLSGCGCCCIFPSHHSPLSL